MKVIEILKSKKTVISFEFFPPRKPENEPLFWDTVNRLKKWKPGFVSVTYGAGGSTHNKSIELAIKLHNMGFCTVAHITCISLSIKQLKETLDTLENSGIENVLALRGDPPQQKDFIPPKDAFKYAYQLVEFIKNHYNFCIGVAGYPEGHIESPSLEKDIEYLKLKIDKGAEFVITQLFFDNRYFFDFLERASKAGIDVPIIPGIMPITNYNQIQRFTKLCGASIPKNLLILLEKYKEEPDKLEKAGIEYTVKQCQELIENNVKYLHFYTLNKSNATEKILTMLMG